MYEEIVTHYTSHHRKSQPQPIANPFLEQTAPDEAESPPGSGELTGTLVED